MCCFLPDTTSPIEPLPRRPGLGGLRPVDAPRGRATPGTGHGGRGGRGAGGEAAGPGCGGSGDDAGGTGAVQECRASSWE